jgi:hypothetical protein
MARSCQPVSGELNRHFIAAPLIGLIACFPSNFSLSVGLRQTRERIPSNAWARKIAAPTKPIAAVIVSNIANVPLCPCATENGGHLAQSKRFPSTNTQSDRPRIMRNRRASSYAYGCGVSCKVEARDRSPAPIDPPVALIRPPLPYRALQDPPR